MIDSLSQLLLLMQSFGATRFYAKKLSPNDNSKNQVYLGGNFSALNIIPYKAMYRDDKNMAGSKRDRTKAEVRFFWVDSEGKYAAPDAQLILYPRYPEVRMSGFLRGCTNPPAEIMRVRDEGRVLFLGITREGEVLGYAADASHPATKELNGRNDWETAGVFLEIPPNPDVVSDTKILLLQALKRIYEKRWIASCKLYTDGLVKPYNAMNGGGYTLEAELGIFSNSHAEPDFLGWEIKQYGVRNFATYRPKSPVTLFTPEPTGGIYREVGITGFLKRFGYADTKNRKDRFNFGGIYACNRDFHHATGLRLALKGYDASTGTITDINGGIMLLSRSNEVAAVWNFISIMQHWNRKHAQAVYMPSIFRTPPPEYSYGSKVLLCEHTDFQLFLKAVAAGIIYYDPGIKMEDASSEKPAIKQRSQFRIKHNALTTMYHRNETVDLAGIS